MKKYIYTSVNEYFDSLNQYRLLERARINNKIRFPYDVFVYGGTKYGHGRQEHGEPHFHYSDDIDSNNAEFKFSVRIPEVVSTEMSQVFLLRKDIQAYQNLGKKHGLEDVYAHSIENRIKKVKRLLKQHFENHSNHA